MDPIYVALAIVGGLAVGGFGGSRFGAARAGGSTIWQALKAVISGGGGPTPPK